MLLLGLLSSSRNLYWELGFYRGAINKSEHELSYSGASNEEKI
jgi:hypothetical protein